MGNGSSIIEAGLAQDEVLRILIADDNDSDRLILQTIVRKEGHRVYTARDGQEAIDIFKEESPDLVLLDALMPNVDGFEAARTIKELSGDNLVPIIFLTSLRDATSLADCLAAGGLDFLSKPYNRIILQAKIKAFASMRRLHETVQKQRDEISLHNDRLIHEQEVAKQVFDNIAHPGCINAPNIKYLLSPMAVFNGDLVLASRKPSGGMYVFLGDFTGHGLPAAIGAMPVSEIFYGMAQKGFSLQDILREINKKLKRILPVGVFCCACMVDLSFRKRSAEIWVGGLPDILIYRKEMHKVENISSRHLPLGVVDNDRFKTDSTLIQLTKGDRIMLWSDGIIEASNMEGEMFGEERVMEVILSTDDPDKIFSNIEKAVEHHAGRGEQDDDYTMVEVIMVNEEDMGDYFGEGGVSYMAGGPKDWSMTYELRPQTLREFNPLPLITHLLMEVPGLRPHSGKIYTILSELYSNALEHGVLNLHSELKASADGFARYYLERTEKLASLDAGFVRFKIDHLPVKDGGVLTIVVEDTGPGFDFKQNDTAQHRTEGYSGRGIPLINTMCRSVRYLGEGNQVEVVFDWHVDV
ncbi:fused response regulator/phosphatase [Ketobacter sp. MCCC 1A13808]|uniref:ATP-binding SpoIIE family protein phosphatase n=1 Tax=Ketobacter sp. MCCC 1A13808 TaxID=2602738 RepID=UPI000F2B72FC|nr:fused response regulator/phosphatase [Ketobacter sp. MCCC 1A13808]MVF12849.1 fused response regulator/phosphatase [Ketobacter sp. MCCC 1A13808]RLP54477.1 MAG: response regulator [Ketobacter sp.]